MRITTLATAAVALLITSAAPAFAEGKQDFDLVNRTGYTIEEVYVSPSAADEWEEDILGRDTLVNGDKVHINFNRSTNTCKWDLKVVYDDKEEAEWAGFDLCQVSKVTIFYDGNSGKTSAEYE